MPKEFVDTSIWLYANDARDLTKQEQPAFLKSIQDFRRLIYVNSSSVIETSETLRSSS